MAEPWVGSYVRSVDDDIGLWTVIENLGNWVRCVPKDSTAIELSKVTPDGIVDFRKRDIIRDYQVQEERLL